jgi:hypothetical protein
MVVCSFPPPVVAAANIDYRGTTSGTTTITAPTGAVDGDFLLVIAGSVGGWAGASAPAIDTPTDWTAVRDVTAISGSGITQARMKVLTYKWNTGEPTSWTLTGATRHTCLAYGGVDVAGTGFVAENIVTHIPPAGATANITTPVVDNTSAGSRRVCGWMAGGYTTVPTWAGYSPADTEIAEAPSLAVTHSAAAIATGNTSVTATASNLYPSFDWNALIAWIGVLKPA